MSPIDDRPWVDLKTDYAFKQLFGQPQTTDILRAFLNGVLHREGADAIAQVRVANSEQAATHYGGKTKRLDIYAQTDRQERINLEIQVGREPATVPRALLYWASMFEAQAVQGMDYRDLAPTLSINVLNFRLFHSTADYHTTYHIYQDPGHLGQLTDMLALHMIELPKFRRLWRQGGIDLFDDGSVPWLLLLDASKNARNRAILEDLAMSDTTLDHALRVWEEISHDPDQYAAFLSRRKALLDEASQLHRAETRGLERGLARGMREGEIKGKLEGQLEVARTMLASGEPLERVVLFTGLDRETLRAVQLGDPHP